MSHVTTEDVADRLRRAIAELEETSLERDALAEIERLRAAIDEHMRTVCNDPKAAGRGADEKLWALVAHDVGADRGT